MVSVPTPPGLKALDKCANCGHDKADHLPRCTNPMLGTGKYCDCDSFHETAPTKEVKPRGIQDQR